MEAALWEKLITTAAGTGLGTLLLILAIWWLNRSHDKLLSELQTERKQRFEVLERRSEICEEDRRELHKEIHGLQSKVAELYELRIRDARECATDQG